MSLPFHVARTIAVGSVFTAKLDARARGYCPHTPTEKQAEFLALDGPDAFFGGAAGGGKSDALLMSALQYVHVPGYAALIIRKTFRDLALPGAIMDRAIEWLKNTDARWDREAHTFTFPSGARLVFGYLDTKDDHTRYQSAEFQYVGVDENGQIPWAQQRYLFSRMRKPTAGPLSAVPLRGRGAGNPGGISHEAVRRHYVDPKTRKAPFIPSMLTDNPHVDGASYRRMLSELDEHTRLQLELGQWTRDPSSLVYDFDEQRNLIEVLPESNGSPWVRVLGLDFGVTNATSFNLLCYRDNDPRVYVTRSFKKRGMITDDAAGEIVKIGDVSKMVGDIGGLGKLFVEELRRRFAIPVAAAQKTDKLGFIKLMNGALQKRRLLIVREPCAELVEEIAVLPWRDETHQEEAPGFENHCADGTLYGWRECRNYHETEPLPPPPPEEAMRQQAEQYWRDYATNNVEREWWDDGQGSTAWSDREKP